MRAPCCCGAIIALLCCGFADADVIDIGRFENIGDGLIDYQGEFTGFITTHQTGELGEYTMIEIDLDALLGSVGAVGFASITTVDTGDNVYTSAPGADIDLFRVVGIDNAIVEYLYEGPTEIHQDETSEQLAVRVGTLNWGTGGGDLGSMTFTSLGEEGALSMSFAGNEGGGIFLNQSGLMNDDLVLELSEAGASESFRVLLNTAVPSPGAAALLGIAAFAARGRRRRER